MSKISYREEVNRVDSPHSCTSSGYILYATSRDGVIDIKLLPNKIVQDSRGLATSSDKTGHEGHNTRSKRAIPLLATAQGTAAIGGMLIKGINALVDAK